MDIEVALISKVIELKDVKSVVKQKITPKMLYGPAKKVLEFILEYQEQYNDTPTPQVIKRYFPDFVLEPYEEPLFYFCDEIRTRQKYNRMAEGINKLTNMLKDMDVDNAFKMWQKLGTQIAIETTLAKDTSLIANAEERVERYLKMQQGFGLLGIPYPWAPLNDMTGGIMSEELISIVGWQKVGKTWALLSILHKAWLEGKKVALFTREMSNEQMERRLDAIHFRLPFKDFKQGRLGEQLFEKYKSGIKTLAGMPEFIISSDEDAGSGLSGIRAKLEEYQPDIFGIDGLYLVHDERGNRGDSSWENIVHLTQDTKKLCRNLGIPGIVTTQAGADSQKKGGVQLTNIAFSKIGFGADSDLVIGLDLLDPETWRLKVMAAREGETLSFNVNRNFRQMDFSQQGDTVTRDGEETEATEEVSEEEKHGVIIY